MGLTKSLEYLRAEFGMKVDFNILLLLVKVYEDSKQGKQWSLMDMSNELQIPYSTAQKILKRLENYKFVKPEQDPDPERWRYKYLTLTDSGEALMTKFYEISGLDCEPSPQHSLF